MLFCGFSGTVRCSCKYFSIILWEFSVDRLVSIGKTTFTIEQRGYVVSTLDNLL